MSLKQVMNEKNITFPNDYLLLPISLKKKKNATFAGGLGLGPPSRQGHPNHGLIVIPF